MYELKYKKLRGKVINVNNTQETLYKTFTLEIVLFAEFNSGWLRSLSYFYKKGNQQISH